MNKDVKKDPLGSKGLPRGNKRSFVGESSSGKETPQKLFVADHMFSLPEHVIMVPKKKGAGSRSYEKQKVAEVSIGNIFS